VAQTLEVEQAAIGGKADLAQRGQVGQAFGDVEVVGVADRGLGPEGAAFPVFCTRIRSQPNHG
jgi:hypothetical protein